MNNLIFNSRDELIQVNPNDIVYFQADGNYSIMMLALRREQLLTMNLSKIQLLLNEQLNAQSALFERVGRDLIIRKSYIYSILTLKKKLILAVPNSEKFFEVQVSKEALKSLKENQQMQPIIIPTQVQLRDLQTRQIYPLVLGQNRLGRKSNTSECELAIDNGDSKISRQQFNIVVSLDIQTGIYAYNLTDLNSANGTFLNEERIPTQTATLLLIGATIRVGKTEFVMEKIDLDKTEIF